jgi:hypothetical protein
LNFGGCPVSSLELNIELWRVSSELTGHAYIRQGHIRVGY